MVCELSQKLDILWSFIKTHLKVGNHGSCASCRVWDVLVGL